MKEQKRKRALLSSLFYLNTLGVNILIAHKKFAAFVFLFLNIVLAQNKANTLQATSFEKKLEETGDVLQFALPVAALAVSIQKKDYTGSKQMFLSYAANLALTRGLKKTIQKKRPLGQSLDAFPSGHTSSAFSGASLLYRRYGWQYGGPALSLIHI